MEGLLLAIEQWPLTAYFRAARWGYAALNATHIAGIAMLFGAILPMDLRLMGAWADMDRRQLARVLVPVAAAGLIIAVTAGFLMFSIRATEYAALTVFRIKMALVCFGAAWAIGTHAVHGLRLEQHPEKSLRVVGAVSLLTWVSALVCGRLIAFMA